MPAGFQVRRAAVGTVLVLTLVLAACGDASPVAPDSPDDVYIRLSVSGGIAGVDYAIVVDGRQGLVVGDSCLAHCDFEGGDVLLPVSADQVAALARLLEAAGIREVDGRDFGLECCDDFSFDLTYRTGGREYRVTGGGGSLPSEMAAAVSLLHGLVQRVAPILVAPETEEADWPRDAYTMGPVTVDGLRLSAKLTFSGGCGEHRMDLVAWGGWLESFPVQINALITHDDGDDPCDGVLVEDRAFNLTPLRDAYEDAYGPIRGLRPTVILRLWDPASASPVGRLIEVPL